MTPSLARNMPIKLTDDEVHDRATSRGFTLLSAYTNMNTPVIFLCGHGHTWKAKPAWVLSGAHGRGCPHCAGIGKLNQDVINERLAAAGVPIRMIGPYHTVVTKSLFRCEHGHEWRARPADIVNSHKGCPKCFAARVRWTPEEINADLSTRGIEMLGEYRSTNHHTEFRCSEGHIWRAIPTSVLSGVGCPQCADSGFKPHLPADFYVVRIFSEAESYLGFGITSSMKNRMKAHRCAVAKKGYSIELLENVAFDRGADALDLERKVKAETTAVDLGVSGFRKEATSMESYPTIRRLMESFVP